MYEAKKFEASRTQHVCNTTNKQKIELFIKFEKVGSA